MLIFGALFEIFKFCSTKQPFDKITYHEYYPMSHINPVIDKMWSTQDEDDLDDVFWPDFEYVGCDQKIHDRRHFYKRFIHFTTRPLAESGSYKPIVITGDPHYPENKKYSYEYYYVDLVWPVNGRRVGIELVMGDWTGVFYGWRAYVYNCSQSDALVENHVTSRNHLATFKAQKLFDKIFDVLRTTRVDRLLGSYFVRDFKFEECPTQINPLPKKFNTFEFIERFLGPDGYRFRPRVTYAMVTEMSWNKLDKVERGYEWQMEIEWAGRVMQMEMANVDDLLLLTKGREWPCQSEW